MKRDYKSKFLIWLLLFSFLVSFVYQTRKASAQTISPTSSVTSTPIPTLTPLPQSTVETVFKYDSGGQRIYKGVTGGDHTYYIDPTLEVTITPTGSVSWRRSYSFSGVTAIENYSNQVTKVNYIHPDHLGSTTLITDDQGKVSTNQVYYPFGETRYLANNQQPSTINPTTDRQYTNQISDQDTTGLYYYNARYYNPQLAKFTQADTVQDGLNRYSYTSNNPINATDPSGSIKVPYYEEEKEFKELAERRFVTQLKLPINDRDYILSKNYIPDNLMSCKDLGINCHNIDIRIQSSIANYLKNFINAAKGLGFDLVVTSGYRSYEEQYILHKNSPANAAPAGQSQHQTGLAVDIWVKKEDGRLSGMPNALIELAWSFGLVHPLDWDPPHFVILDAPKPGISERIYDFDYEYQIVNQIANNILLDTTIENNWNPKDALPRSYWTKIEEFFKYKSKSLFLPI